MKIRNRLLSTVVMMSGAMGMAGIANATQTVQPDSSWAISKIAASQQAGGGAYCALARRFSNDMVLTLARNGNDESSMAVDFQRSDALNKNASYYVVIKAGKDQERSFNVHPVSGRALVVRLGKDYAFYDALNRSTELAVKIGDDDYSFAMNDFSAGQDQMNGCLSTLLEPAAGGPDKSEMATAAPPSAPPAAAAAAPNAAAAAMQAKVTSSFDDDLPAKKSKARDVADSAPARSAPKEEKFAGLSDAKGVPTPTPAPVTQVASSPLPPPDTDMKATKEAAQAAVDNALSAAETQKQIQALHEENVRLRTALETARQSYENKTSSQDKNGSVVSEMTEKVNLLSRQNSDLKAQVAAIKAPADVKKQAAAVGQAKSMETANAQLRAEIDTLHMQLAQLDSRKPSEIAAAAAAAATVPANDKVSAEAAKKMIEADQKLAEAAAKNAEAESRLAASNQKIITNADTQTSIDQKLADATKQLDAATKKAAEADQKLADANTRAAVVSQAQALSDQKLADAILQLDQANKRAGAAEQKLASASTTADTSAIADAQTKLDAANKKAAEADQKLSMLHDQMAAFDKQKADIVVAKANDADLAAAKLAAEQKVADLTNRLDDANAKLATTEQKVASLSTQPAMSAADKADADRKLADANKKLADTQAKLAEISQKITAPVIADRAADKQTAATLASLQTQLDGLQKENSSLKDTLKVAQSTTTPAAVAGVAVGIPPEQLHSVQAELEAVKHDRDHLSQQIADMSNSQENHLLKISSADWNLEEATRRYNESQREIRSLGTKLDQSGAQCEADKKKYEAQLFDPAIATKAQIEKVSMLEQQVDQTHAQLSAAQQRIAALESSKSVAVASAAPPPVVTNITTASVSTKAGTVSERDKTEKTAMLDTKALTGKAADLAKVAPAAGPSVSPDSDTSGDSARPPAPVQAAAIPAIMPNLAAIDRAPAPVPDVAGVARATAAMVSGTTGPALITAQGLQNFLMNTVPLKGNVTKLPSGAGTVAYKWESGDLFGSAEQQPMGNPTAYDTYTARYLAKIKAHCKGTFAAKPGVSKTQDGTRVSAYEIACVGGGDASASVVFFSQNGLFTTIAHEGSLDNMDVAMDVSDKLVSKISQSKLASN